MRVRAMILVDLERDKILHDALTQTALDQLFCEARSYNGYVDRPVAFEQIERIWNLLRFGPTSANCLPARFIWCTSDAARQELAGFVSPGNQAKILSAPVTVIIGMDMAFYDELPVLFPHDDARSWFADAPDVAAATAFRNSSLQGGYLIMGARAMGLDVGPLSGFDAARVDAHYFAGTMIKSNFMATMGHGDPSTIFERSPRPAFDHFNRVL